MGDIEGETLGVLNDKIMKVANFHNPELTVEVNVSEKARNLLGGVSAYVNELAIQNDLPHFQCSIGIPNFVTLEKNIVDYFNNYNTECLTRFAKSETSNVHARIEKLAKELGVDLPKFDHLEWNKLALEVAKENLKCDNAHEIANAKMIKGVENLKTKQAALSAEERHKD